MFAHEQTFCTHVHRYLDFVYVGTEYIGPILELQKIYPLLCDSWFKTIRDNCTYNSSVEFIEKDRKRSRLYKCNKSVADELLAMTDINAFNDKCDVTATGLWDWLDQSADYLQIMCDILLHIDKLKLLREYRRLRPEKCVFKDVAVEDGTPQFITAKNPSLVYVYRNICEVFTENIFRLTNDSTKQSCDQLKMTTDAQLKTENDTYIKTIFEKHGKPALPVEKIVDVMKFIRVLMVFSFHSLERYFSNHFTGSDEYVEREVIEQKMIDTFKNVCDYATLIVFYLKDDNHGDTRLIDLYGLYCSGNVDLYRSRCLSADGVWYSSRCVIRSLNEKFMVNNYYNLTINDQVALNADNNPYNDPLTVPVLNSDKSIVNEFNYTEYMLKYIKTVHGIIQRYCTPCVHTLEWKALDWLWKAGYFVTKEFDNSVLNQLKHETMDLNGVQVTLSTVYYSVLPWHSNVNTIKIFHNHVMRGLDKLMSTFLYRHLKLIFYYFGMFSDFNYYKFVFTKLLDSITWYTSTTMFVNKYLCLSDTYKPRLSTKNITQIIENDDVDLLARIDREIPIDENEDLKRWLNGIINDRPNSNILIGTLREKTKENCKLALEFRDDFIQTVKEIMTIEEVVDLHVTKRLKNKYCVEKIEYVFNRTLHI